MASVTEQFALAADRSTALAQLVPGSADHLYLATLHALNTGDGAAAKKHLEAWRPQARSLGNQAQFEELEGRYHLVS